MTGDGVNDVFGALRMPIAALPYLRQRRGARQVAQLVLLDSDFSCLPEVVMEGRRVINNITRTASMYLIKTVFSFLLSVITVFTLFNYPFTPIQLTLISMFCVGIPTFFLALLDPAATASPAIFFPLCSSALSPARSSSCWRYADPVDRPCFGAY